MWNKKAYLKLYYTYIFGKQQKHLFFIIQTTQKIDIPAGENLQKKNAVILMGMHITVSGRAERFFFIFIIGGLGIKKIKKH